jgi:hypothetical protein
VEFAIFANSPDGSIAEGAQLIEAIMRSRGKPN